MNRHRVPTLQVSLAAILCLFLLCVPVAGRTATEAREIPYAESPELHRKLQNVYDNLRASGITEPIQGYRLRIVDTDSVNALVFPGVKTILFTKPLVEQFSTDEICFIFGHEIAHVKLGHYGKRVALSTGTSLLMKAIDMALPGAGLFNYLINPAVTNTFSRTQEIDADLETVRMMKVTYGYAPALYVKILEKLRDISVSKGYRETDRTGILDTHPNIVYRISKVKEYAKKNNW
jgi:Zn-dependent protease with chaperone function